MLSNEIWKPIKGYEGLYEISNLGRVKALERKKNFNRGYGTTKEHFMKPNNYGTCDYYRVPLTNRNHVKKYYLVHRLVAENFLENPKNLPQINHKDGNKLNNCIDNLEWCTYKQNIIHSWKNGLSHISEEHKQIISKATKERWKKYRKLKMERKKDERYKI